ncbi:MAG TPA: hypothetical protein VF681_14740 [Abditibacteriaceae bacterium]|jgi:hypothetical protein
MSLFDQVRQTLGDAANTARDVGQNLGAQAAAQLALKKLQLEAGRKTHELGARVYEWHRSGTLVATGAVPREVSDLCHSLDDINRQIGEENAKLEAAKREAELRAAQAKAPTTSSITIQEASPPVTPQTSTEKITAPLSPLAASSGDTMTTPQTTAIQPHITALGPSIPGPTNPGLPSMPQPGLPTPTSNPDMPSVPIPVPGGDLPTPGTPAHQTPSPDMPPSGPTTPTMPGQPL